MASAGLRMELKCSICLNLYTDPVTLRCGHNFCQGCIDHVLNTQEKSGVYYCPICKEKFEKRPALQKNITLCNEVGNFLSSPPHQKVITGIRCTYCIHSHVPAVKSCLMSEASLCDKHLKVHSKEAEHVLTKPRTSLEIRKCSIHKEVLKYYCTDDAACICVSCSLIGEHNGHMVESLDEASEKKKEKLRNVLQKLITKREKTEEKVQSLEDQKRKAQEKTAGEAERVTALFIDIRRRLEDLEKRILSEISRQEKEESRSLSTLIHQLEKKKDELSRKMRDIEELCNMTNPLTVLQEPDTGDLCDPEEGGDEDTDDFCDPKEEGSDEDTDDLCDLEEEAGNKDTWGHGEGDRGLDLISHVSHKLSDIIRDVTFCVDDPVDILLDVNTAGNNILMADMKNATWTGRVQNRPETAVRFQDYSQVISGRRFSSGRHYWDVETSEAGIWRVGMCYPSIDRRGYQSLIGDNNKSWVLCGGQSCNKEYSVIHDSEVILLPHQISSDRVRIYLDYEAGQLSFYELCYPIRHLHTFTTTFTEPLHAALYVWKSSINISGGATAVRSRHRGNLPRDWRHYKGQNLIGKPFNQ